MKNIPSKTFLALSGLLLLVNAIWFLAGGPVLQQESFFRIITGGLLLFILPGLVWGEIAGFRSEHPLEAIALSFTLTLIIETALMAVAFFLHATIHAWIASLLVVSLAGVLLLVWNEHRGRGQGMITSLWSPFRFRSPLDISAAMSVVVVLLVSLSLYRWGEAVFDIDGEKLLQLAYVRYYASLPLSLNDLGVIKGSPPPNLINLWEFLIAAWSALIRVDPLVVAYRARFVIPLFGFSAVYLLVKNVFSRRMKTDAVFWGVLLMCLGWFGIVSPTHLEWVKADPLRGLFSFMGTVHHADTAMEILMPLNAALILYAFREQGWRGGLVLAGSLAASFLWHTREFFQAIVYFMVFGIMLLLLPSADKRALMRSWGRLFAVIMVMIITFAILLAVLVPSRSFGYDDFALRRVAFIDAVASMIDFRSPLHFPVEVRLTRGLDARNFVTSLELLEYIRNTWSYYLWLILSAFAVPVLAIAGGKDDRRLLIFYLLLWFLTLCWGFSQFMLIVLTYSEILFTLPRMIYLFSYIVASAALVTVFERLDRWSAGTRLRLMYAVFATVMTGLALRLWWNLGVPFAQDVSWALGIVFLASFLIAVVFASKEKNADNAVHFSRIVIGLILFFGALLGKEYMSNAQKLIVGSRPPVAWFEDNNPFGLSRQLISFVRTLPPGRTFAVDPFGAGVVSLYSPQYTVVLPEIMGRTVITALDSYRAAAQGADPLFRSPGGALPDGGAKYADAINHAAVIAMLKRTSVDYILVESKYYDGLIAYVNRHPEAYNVVFNSSFTRELVVQFVKS